MDKHTKELIDEFARILYEQDTHHKPQVPYKDQGHPIKRGYRAFAKPFVLAAKTLGYEKVVERELPKYYCGYVDYEKDYEGEYDMNKPIFHDLYNTFNSNQRAALGKAGYKPTQPIDIEEASNGR